MSTGHSDGFSKIHKVFLNLGRKSVHLVFDLIFPFFWDTLACVRRPQGD